MRHASSVLIKSLITTWAKTMDDLTKALQLLRKAKPIIERSLGKTETVPPDELGDEHPASILADIEEFLLKAQEPP